MFWKWWKIIRIADPSSQRGQDWLILVRQIRHHCYHHISGGSGYVSVIRERIKSVFKKVINGDTFMTPCRLQVQENDVWTQMSSNCILLILQFSIRSIRM